MEVTSVSNGEAAVRRVPDLNPDLILADIFMPVRNGYELCEWVKKESKYSHIPVILLVGAFDPLDEKEARRVGADGVLKKPFIPPDPLIAMVTSTLEKIPKGATEPAPGKPAAPIAAPVPVAAASTPAKVPAAPTFVILTPDSQETDSDFGFGGGRADMRDDPEDAASVAAPKADFGHQAEDEFEEPEPQNDWRPSPMAFEAQEEEPQERESALDVAAPAAHGGPGQTEGHAGELGGTLGVEESDEFFEEPAAPQESAGLADSHAQPAAPHVAEPEPSFSSKSSHWMDLMSSTAAGQPQRDWLSTLGASQPAEHPGPLEAAGETENGEVAPAGAEQFAPEANVLEPGASSHEVHENTQPAGASEDGFFADEAQTPSDAASVSRDEVHAPEQASVAEDKSEAVHIEWPPAQRSEPLSAEKPWQVSATPVEQRGDSSMSFVHDDASGSRSVPEPELVVPSPVRPSHEPLLIDESEKKSSDYDAREEEIPPAFSFLPEVERQSAEPSASTAGEPEAPASAEAEFSYEESALAAARETRADASFSEPPAAEAQPFDEEPADSLQASPAAANQEVSAAGSPSREDVAAIPFLNPPAGFVRDEDGAGMEEAAPADGVAVEEVVERVLSKIEPQLRDLLSQNLKPLIENLIQNELQKKER